MCLLARSGQRSAALRQYETCRHTLADELGVEPHEETTALYERIRTAGAARLHNLPDPPTPFIGRRELLQQIAECLGNPACRLLTLPGLGGIGKTHLALQAAREALDGKSPMNARKLALTVLLVLTVLMAACAPAAAPAPTAPPPAAVPTTAPVAAFDMKATLDKYFSDLPDGFGTIAPAAFKDQMGATQVFLVDVREAKEVADNGYIEGAVNIPIRMFAKNLDKLPAKDQPIVVTCGSGHRSALGMEALQLLGYTNVKSLAGGFGAWKKANLPVVTGKPTDPVAGQAATVDKDLLAALDKYFSNLPDGFGTIAPAVLNDQLAAAKPFQVDVREAKEITDNGIIAGSTNVPVRTLIKGLDKLPQDKSAVIIAECGSGHRSALAMMALNLLGYTNVKSLAGGFGAWKAANLPIAK
jgi:rhodanese-related sulfurtransferase